MTSCLLCRHVFPTANIDPDGGPAHDGCLPDPARRPRCPYCGDSRIVAGVFSCAEFERRHVLTFGAFIILPEALADAGVEIHSVSRIVDDPELIPLVDRRTDLLVLGPHQTLVLVDAPKDDRPTWRIRIPTSVIVRPGNAHPGRAARLHEAAIAVPLRANGFICLTVEVDSWDRNERHRAVWERTVAGVGDVAKAIKGILKIETMVDPDPDDGFWKSMGDIEAMQLLADRCIPPFASAAVTPWGITLCAKEGRELAVITESGHGTFNLAVLLPAGHGARAARKQAGAVLQWFKATQTAEWHEHGFSGARIDGSVQVAVEGGHRWAVSIALTFTAGPDVATKLGWACEHRCGLPQWQPQSGVAGQQ